jgi:hypothetical protein
MSNQKTLREKVNESHHKLGYLQALKDVFDILVILQFTSDTKEDLIINLKEKMLNLTAK